MKIENFRRVDGGGNKVGTFDCEVIPGLKLTKMKLMLNSQGQFHVFGRGVYVVPPVSDIILAAVMQLPVAEADND